MDGYSFQNERPKVVDLGQYRWHRAAFALRRRLGDFADRPFLTKEMDYARQFYFEFIDPEFLEEYDGFISERFFEWFIFDYSLSTGKTVMELFAESSDLSTEESALLSGWMSSRLTFYEVREVFFGRGVVLEELFGKKRFLVHDNGVARDIQPGMILYIRVLKVGDVYEFSTSGLILPAFWKDVLVARVGGDIKTFCRKRKLSLPEGREVFWKEKACLLNAWVIELGMSSYLFFQAGAEEGSEQQPDGEQDSLSGESGKTGQSPFLRSISEPGYAWPSQQCSRVAVGVIYDLKERGYSRVQIESALRLWHDYCSRVGPTIRKVPVWVAAVVYAMARLEFDRRVNQQYLAGKYGVSASTISSAFRSICRELELVAFDRRYSTRRLVLPDLLDNYSFLAKILKSLKL